VRLREVDDGQAESVDGQLEAIAAALRQQRATWTADAGLTAASYLPASHDHKHEHAQLRALAAAYAGGRNREDRHDAGTTSSSLATGPGQQRL